MFLRSPLGFCGAAVLEVLQYGVDAWSGQSKLFFRLPALKIHVIYGPHIGDVTDIKLIRTVSTLDLSQKVEKRYFKFTHIRYGQWDTFNRWGW